jgi:hypothetical protein
LPQAQIFNLLYCAWAQIYKKGDKGDVESMKLIEPEGLVIVLFKATPKEVAHHIEKLALFGTVHLYDDELTNTEPDEPYIYQVITDAVLGDCLKKYIESN